MSNLPTTTNRPLPTREELVADVFSDAQETEYNLLVNMNPPEAWVKKHPVSKVDYIPIEKVEMLLTRIFNRWWVEIMDRQIMANSVVVTVRLHYLHPDGEWRKTDGIGACPIQTKSGAGAADFMNMQTNGVQLAAPAAESYAIKDAAEKIGRLFGKDISRKEQTDYTFLAQRRGKPQLQIGSWEFDKAVQHLAGGGLLEEIKANYELSADVQEALIAAI